MGGLVVLKYDGIGRAGARRYVHRRGELGGLEFGNKSSMTQKCLLRPEEMGRERLRGVWKGNRKRCWTRRRFLSLPL